MLRSVIGFLRGLRAVEQVAKNNAVRTCRLLNLAVRALTSAEALGRTPELIAELERWVESDPVRGADLREDDAPVIIRNVDSGEAMTFTELELRNMTRAGLHCTKEEAAFLEGLVRGTVEEGVVARPAEVLISRRPGAGEELVTATAADVERGSHLTGARVRLKFEPLRKVADYPGGERCRK